MPGATLPNNGVDQAKFKKLVSDWGRLPPVEQRRALQETRARASYRRAHRRAIVNLLPETTINPALNQEIDLFGSRTKKK